MGYQLRGYGLEKGRLEIRSLEQDSEILGRRGGKRCSRYKTRGEGTEWVSGEIGTSESWVDETSKGRRKEGVGWFWEVDDIGATQLLVASHRN